jgi:anti-sigma factor RsiW
VSDELNAQGQETMVEELVAYLDGELDMDSNRRVERRLAQDAVFRRQLRELQQSWDLLDHLPRADVDESFTESTIAMVALRTSDERRQTEVSVARWSRIVLVTAAVSAALVFVAAFSATRWWAGRQDRQLLEDLSVIENIDEYRYAESIEFLRLLEREGLFVEGGIDHEL